MGLKLQIMVRAGLMPGQPAHEYTRVWNWTGQEQDELSLDLNEETDDLEERAVRKKVARDRWILIHGESREYAATLENPALVNWVSREWVWL